MLRRFLICVMLVGLALPVQSQERSIPVPVLVVDLDRMFRESNFGVLVEQRYDAAASVLEAENARLLAELEAEERELTEQRAEMSVEEFQEAADDFDSRVEAIRRERDATARALQQIRDDGLAEFNAAVEPVLGRIMVQRGATMVISPDSVIVGIQSLDITDAGIAALNEMMQSAEPEVQD